MLGPAPWPRAVPLLPGDLTCSELRNRMKSYEIIKQKHEKKAYQTIQKEIIPQFHMTSMIIFLWPFQDQYEPTGIGLDTTHLPMLCAENGKFKLNQIQERIFYTMFFN